MLRTDAQTHFDKDVSKSFNEFTEDAIKQSSFTQIFEVDDTNVWDTWYTAIEWISKMEYLNEWQEPSRLDIWEWYKVILSPKKFWWSIEITEDARLARKDNTVLLDKYANELINWQVTEAKSFIEREAHVVINDCFAWAEFLAPDWNPLIWAHTWKSTWLTFNNRHATNAPISIDAMKDLDKYWADFLDPFWKVKPLNFDTIYVRKWWDAHTTAVELFAQHIVPTKVWDINIYEWRYKIVADPYLFDWANKHTSWIAIDSSMPNPLVVSFIKRPSMLSQPFVDKADTWTYWITWFFKRWIVKMPSNIYGSDWKGS